MAYYSLAEAALRIERELNENGKQLHHPIESSNMFHPYRLTCIEYEDGSGTSFIIKVANEGGKRRHCYLREGEQFQTGVPY